MSLERWKGKIAVVTGASSGIGAAIVEKLMKAGIIVVGLARRKEKVEELAEKCKTTRGNLHSLKVDVTKENEIVEAFGWILENLGPVHILVNNAGVIKPTTLLNGDGEMWRQTLETNVFGLCVATREAAKHMRENDISGHIIHINSIAGHWVLNFPQINVYSASKFAVTALTQVLRNELAAAKNKIKVTSLSPGLVDTNIFQANNLNVDDISQHPMLKSEDIANAAVYVLGTPPHVQILELIIEPL